MSNIQPHAEVRSLLVVLSTFPNAEVATQVARILVTEGLAACVNLTPPIRSIYRWEGSICDESEILAVIKTMEDHFPALRDRLVELHPYDLPEVVALRAADANRAYREWVADETSSNGETESA